MEINEFLFGFILLVILFETMIIIGIYINNKKREKRKNIWEVQIDRKDIPFFIIAIVLGITGLCLMLDRQYDDPKYGIGIAFLALAYAIIFFIMQNRSNKEILDRIGMLEESLKKG